MLKAMRKNLKSLAPTLWLVIAAFVIAIFAVWGGGGGLGEARAANTIATVGRKKISLDLYSQTLMQRLESMSKEFRDLDRKLIQQLGIPQQVMEQLIQQNLLTQAARDMGIDASAVEVRERIMSFPVFQQEGKFVGLDQYKQILEWNRTSVGEFEKTLRQEIIIEKLIKIITAGISVTEDDVFEKYKNENESVRLEYLILQNEKIEQVEEPQLEALKKYYEENKESYQLPEKREGEYIFFNTDELKAEVAVEDPEIDKYYKANRSQFEEPEKTRVSRIFLSLQDRVKEEVRAEAENLLKRLKKGENITALAQIYSKDEKALEGGDWGYDDWRRLSSKETEEIARLSQGENSAVLELEDGFSIIMVTEKTQARLKPLEEVKENISGLLLDEKTRALAEARAKKIERDALREKSLDVAAQKNELKVKSTGLLANGDALGDIDPSGSLSRALFEIKEKEITPVLYTYKGAGVAQLIKVDPPRTANFEEVQDEVKTQVFNIEKKEKALERIKQIKEELAKESMDKLAEKYGAEYKTAEEHKRNQYLSVVGENREIDTLAFSLPLEQLSEPIEFADGYVLIKVLGRKEVTKDDFEKQKKEEKEKLLEQKRNAFLFSHIMKLREEKGVRIKYNLFLKVNSDVLSRFGGTEGS